MADNTKDAAPAPAEPPKIDGSKVDPEKLYRVQLGKYVPDYRGSEMTKLQPYHLFGAAVLELLHVDPDCIATLTEDDSLHPDAKAPETLDPHESHMTDARKFKTQPVTSPKPTAPDATRVVTEGIVTDPSVAQVSGKNAKRR